MKPPDKEHIAILHVFEATKDRLYHLFIKQTGDEHVTADMMQEAYLRIWRHRASIDMATAENYLFTVAYRLLADWHRSKIRSRIRYMESLPDMTDTDTPDTAYELKATQQTMAGALAQLSPQQRAAYEMIREEERSYREAAQLLNVPVSTLEKRLAAGLKVLRKALHLFC